MSNDTFDYKPVVDGMPEQPGCYLMRSKGGKIIYIGKAKNLKNRVKNYFQKGSDTRAFISALPYELESIEVIITANEKEALILEANLIKRHKPKYNVRLRDNKQYLSLRIDTKKKWPRVEVIRQRRDNDSAKLFGPYESAHAIRQTLNILNKHFRLRTCPDSVLRNRNRPCLQYQIKRCPGPCVIDVDREEYAANVRQTVMFLEGRTEELEKEIRKRMYEASDRYEYELAAQFRDQLQSIEKVRERQTVVAANPIDRDAFNFYRKGDRVTVEVLFVRRGRLQGAKHFHLKDQVFPDDEMLSSFLSAYYCEDIIVPSEVLLPLALPESDMETLGEFLSELRGSKVLILLPKRGAKATLLETAAVNAQHHFEEQNDLEDDTNKTLHELKRALKLPVIPTRMECYDISNLQGKQIVGSQVVFINGEPAKEEYRHYRMKEVTSQDDFASMHELLSRRFQHVIDGEEDPPELIVIDGGKGQLGQAVTVLNDLGIHETTVISLAKSRVDKTGFDDPEITRSRERVFIPNQKNPILLRKNSAELYLLERIRDEAHRFAITFHKNLRRKETLQSGLEDIKGVGRKTRTALLKHFKSLRAIKEASYHDLLQVPGVGPAMAREIFTFYNGVSPDDLSHQTH